MKPNNELVEKRITDTNKKLTCVTITANLGYKTEIIGGSTEKINLANTFLKQILSPKKYEALSFNISRTASDTIYQKDCSKWIVVSKDPLQKQFNANKFIKILTLNDIVLWEERQLYNYCHKIATRYNATLPITTHQNSIHQGAIVQINWHDYFNLLPGIKRGKIAKSYNWYKIQGFRTTTAIALGVPK